jgi:hypothetical protein
MYQSPLLSPEAHAILAGWKQNPNYGAAVQQTGLASLEDALRLKNMADEVSKSGQMQGPPPGNVVDQLKMQVQSALYGPPQGMMPPQGMPPQGAMPPPQGMPPQGMPPQQAMPPQGMPPQQAMPQPAPGLAGLPVSNIGTQNMASGGIVAFADGGDIYGTPAEDAGLYGPYRADFVPPIAEERLSDRGPLEEAPPEEGAGLDAMLFNRVVEGLSAKPLDIETFRKESEAENARLGIGKSLEKRIGILAKRAEEEKGLSEKDLEDLKKQSKNEAAAGFFGAAGRGNKTFLGALGEGLEGLAKTKSATAKEERALAREQKRAQQSLEDANLSVEEAQEKLRSDTSEKARQQYDAAVARREAAADRAATLGANLSQTAATLRAAIAKGSGSLTTDKLAASYLSQADALAAEGKIQEAQLMLNKGLTLLEAKAGVPGRRDAAALKVVEDNLVSLRAALRAIRKPDATNEEKVNARNNFNAIAGAAGRTPEQVLQMMNQQSAEGVSAGVSTGGAAEYLSLDKGE